jgi:tetratricopeptide (TPR) repeat protein
MTFCGVMALTLLGCSTPGLFSKNQNKNIPGFSVEKAIERQKASQANDIPVIESHPLTADEYERLGDALLSRGNLPIAFLQYERSLKQNPDNIRIEYKKGLALLAGKKYDDAISQFQRVISKNPGYAKAYEGLGQAYYKKKKKGFATETTLRKAVQLDPTLWRAHNCLGNMYDQQKRHSLAIRHYKAAVLAQPQKGFLYNNLGVSFSLMAMNKDAVAAFKKAIAAKYTTHKVYNNLGLALAHLERYDEALDAFKKGGTRATAYNNLGCVYLNQGKFEKAVAYFEKAIEIDPSFYVKANANLKKARVGVDRL